MIKSIIPIIKSWNRRIILRKGNCTIGFGKIEKTFN
jgi:hypothetical protein